VIRTIIVDDEPLARRGIRARLERAGGYAIVAECGSGREAIAAIREQAPSVVFLDVQMPGIDGFGVIDQIGADRMPVVIFVTAYDTHALRAFEAHAFDYLLKPIDDDRFAVTLDRARRRVVEREESEVARRLAALMHDLRPALDAADAGRQSEPATPPSQPNRIACCSSTCPTSTGSERTATTFGSTPVARATSCEIRWRPWSNASMRQSSPAFTGRRSSTFRAFASFGRTRAESMRCSSTTGRGCD
jgi:CheY-like chemotaxis protein